MRSLSPIGRRQREILLGNDDVESEDEWEEDISIPISDEGLPYPTSDLDEQELASDRAKDSSERRFRYESAYVHAMRIMIRDVAKHELHLFTLDEQQTISSFLDATYEEQFVLSRLVLRKPGWHTLSSLEKWKEEIGEQALKTAINGLCQPFESAQMEPSEPSTSTTASLNPIQIQNFDPSKPIPRPPDSDSTSFDPQNLHLEFFLEDSRCMTLEEAINCLPGESLRKLARTFNIQVAKSTNALFIAALLGHAEKQSILAPEEVTPKSRKRKSQKDGLRQTVLPFARMAQSGSEVPRKSQQERLKELVMTELGTCIRMNPCFHHLVHRLHLVCYRCTEHPKALLLPHLLTHFRKRSYPPYQHERCGDIWRDRFELLVYEEALAVQARLEDLLAPPKEKYRVDSSSAKPTPKRTPVSEPMSHNSSSDTHTEDPQPEQPDPSDLSNGQKIALDVKRFVEDKGIYEKWKNLLAAEEGKNTPTRIGLERFQAGWIYTRVLTKFAHCLGQLKEYQYEVRILDALLSQRRWRRGKRAYWYERKALIKEKYLSRPSVSPPKQKSQAKDLSVIEEARTTVLDALGDDDVRLVSRPSLVRRLRRLEKILKLPEEKRTNVEGETLQAPKEITIEGVRIYTNHDEEKHLGPNIADDQLMVLSDMKVGESRKVSLPDDKIDKFFPRLGDDGEEIERPKKPNDTHVEKTKPKWKGKSLWRGNDGIPVTVEQLALEHYESQGFKGFHSETSILTTIFALIFWDILFYSGIPGAFEHAFQIAPLDLLEDCFFRSRKDLIDKRLKMIVEDFAEVCRMVTEIDSIHRECRTWCVGIRWDICSKEEILEIMECLGGQALSFICRLFCEDFAGRCGGVPDLLVWCYERKECKLVEVKGPNDRASESQKLWLDTLFRSGTPAEICFVVDVRADNSRTPRGAHKGRKTMKGKKKRSPSPLSDQSISIDEDRPPTTCTRASSANISATSKLTKDNCVANEEPPRPKRKRKLSAKAQADRFLLVSEAGSASCPVDVDALVDGWDMPSVQVRAPQYDRLHIKGETVGTSTQGYMSPPKVNRAFVEILSPSPAKRRKTR